MKYFTKQPRALQLETIHEYRTLQKINEAVDGGQFENILATVEEDLPAFKKQNILDEHGNINQNYYKLLRMALDNKVSDEQFLDIVLMK